MTPGLLVGMLALGAAAAPVEKDGTWIEVSSADFAVLTDGGTSAARRTILRFEKIRAAFAAVMPSVRLSGERELLVIAPRGEESLRSLMAPLSSQPGQGLSSAADGVLANHRGTYVAPSPAATALSSVMSPEGLLLDAEEIVPRLHPL